jgi:hypothetical protein
LINNHLKRERRLTKIDISTIYQMKRLKNA